MWKLFSKNVKLSLCNVIVNHFFIFLGWQQCALELHNSNLPGFIPSPLTQVFLTVTLLWPWAIICSHLLSWWPPIEEKGVSRELKWWKKRITPQRKRFLKTELLHPIIAQSLCLHSSFLPPSHRPADSLDMVTKVTWVQHSVSIYTKKSEGFSLKWCTYGQIITSETQGREFGLTAEFFSAPIAMISREKLGETYFYLRGILLLLLPLHFTSSRPLWEEGCGFSSSYLSPRLPMC